MTSPGGRGGRRGAKRPDGQVGWTRQYSAALVSKMVTVKGKRYGPYLYRQWRDSDGHVHSEYIGKA